MDKVTPYRAALFKPFNGKLIFRNLHLAGSFSGNRRFHLFNLNENAVMIIMALFVGILGGYGAVVFRWLIGSFQSIFFGHGRDHFLDFLFTLPWYAKLIPPIIGGAIGGAAIGDVGIFAPSLFIGSMTGASFGYLAQFLFPDVTATSGAYGLVGMGAVLAASIHGPINAIIILFEMTGSYKIILPLMISCIISAMLATQIKKESIYTMKLIRRGTDIRAGRDFNVMRSLLVKNALTTDVVTVSENMPLKTPS